MDVDCKVCLLLRLDSCEVGEKENFAILVQKAHGTSRESSSQS